MIVAVPFIYQQPNLAGYDVALSANTRLGDLPWQLHLAAETQERRLLGTNDLPVAVVMDVPAPTLEVIYSLHLRCLTVLQLYGTGSTLCREAWVYETPPEKIARVLQLPIRAFDPGDDFALYAGATEDALSSAFALLEEALSHHPTLQVTLEHFILALNRGDLSKGLLDATICLESLIESQQEVTFRFAHQIGRVVSEGPETLGEAYSILDRLYRFRSQHVHGNRGRGFLQLQGALWADWPEIQRLIKMCLRYVISYKAKHPGKKEWQQHLDALMTDHSTRDVPDWGPGV